MPNASDPVVPNTCSSSASGHATRWRRELQSADGLFRQPETPGVRNMPTDFDSETGAISFLSLFFSSDVWDQLTEMTNLRATRVKSAKPNDYYASKWQNLTVSDMKAFFRVRLSTEYGSSKEDMNCILGRNLVFFLIRLVIAMCFLVIVSWQYGNLCIT